MDKNSTIVNHLGLAPGDTIVAPKSYFNVVQHYAIYLGYDYQGNHYICENAAGHGVKLTTVADFFTEYPQILKVVKFTGTVHQRKALVQNALSMLGQPYDLLNYNCEHFASHITSGKPSSSQVQTALGVLGLGLLITYLSKN